MNVVFGCVARLVKAAFIVFLLFGVVATSARAATNGELRAALPSNLSKAISQPEWATCGGIADPGKMQQAPLLATLLCLSKSNLQLALDILGGLDAAAIDDPRNMPWQAQVNLTEMKVEAAQHDAFHAQLHGQFATFLQKQWDGGSLPEEQTVFWDMVTPDMQQILLAHGGTRASNRDARPQDWKPNGPDSELWIYRSGGAVITTYVFRAGKLTQTLKP